MDEGLGWRSEEGSARNIITSGKKTISPNLKCNSGDSSSTSGGGSTGNTSGNGGGATCTMEKTGPNIPTNARPHEARNGSVVISGEESVAGAESSVSDQSSNNNRKTTSGSSGAEESSAGGGGCASVVVVSTGEKVDCDKSKVVDNGESDKTTSRQQTNSIDLIKQTSEGSTRTSASEESGGEGSKTVLTSSGDVKSVSGKPPVPNFRVEGSGGGDSSITVAVASLSSAVSASISLHNSATRGGSTGGTNSLENGDQPGSSSGPVSIQSSEEMRLSLVSWYSEPDDPSRIIEGCCSVLNTYRQEETESAADIVTRRDVCESGSSMGHEAISAGANNSPVCKSESEEKENKTPEPSCGNRDKGNDSETDKNVADAISEFIQPLGEAGEKNGDCGREQRLTVTVNPGEIVHSSQSSLKQNSNKDRVGTEKSHKSLTTPPQKSRAHVHLSDQKQPCGGGSHHSSRCNNQDPSNKNSKPECPRCSRRSKSGTTTPASGPQIPKTRTPANRRVVQSIKSSTEIKKPIKSILKHDSRGSAGSGSGSDKQSSMDSLGSSGELGVTPVHILRGRMSNALMTRSDSGTRARFNFSSGPPDTPSGGPEDKAVSKLKRIEKYATLRVRKSLKPRPLDLSDCEAQTNDTQCKVGVPGVPGQVMSKSMSYLEKSSSNRVHISSSQGHTYGESNSASSTLKRQGSLRVKKPMSPWEPSGTRTSALRLQKMQEAKAKNSPGGGGSGGGGSSGSANSGSAHSGSGDSLHFLPHSANSTSSPSASGLSSIHLSGAHSAPATHGRMSALAAAKEKHMGAKIFSKLSSALGQTASSNQKRIRQERGVQTDVLSSVPVPFDVGGSGRVSLSPVPALEFGPENAEQIKNLERLCNRYRNQFIKVQSEFEKSESRKDELLKQLEETQHESTEMIEFLQAEKSTLAESLTEVEVEAKKWKDEMEALKRDYQSRCSSLVRLSEQHKQEALKSQALLQRMESQSTSVISQLSHQLVDGTQNIQQTTQRVTALTESLLKTYKVPPELLASSANNQPIKETDLSCSLLLPLITSLSAAFPMVPMDPSKPSSLGGTNSSPPVAGGAKSSSLKPCDPDIRTVTVEVTQPSSTNSLLAMESSSFQSLNQAILEREAAEKSGLDEVLKPFSLFEGASPDADQLSLRKEITELNAAIAKLLNVVRVIVIHCDRKVSSVASSILQCLKSIEDDKVGNMAEIAQVQKSLEAWSEKGISSGGSSSTTTTSSPPCKTSATSASSLVGNGHAHVRDVYP